jgi:hypothetical protein
MMQFSFIKNTRPKTFCIFNAVFCQPSIFQQSVFQWLLSIFQRQVISTFIYFNYNFLHERGKLPLRYYTLFECLARTIASLCLVRLCLSYILTRGYHITTQQNNISLVHTHSHSNSCTCVFSVYKPLKYKIIEIWMHCVQGDGWGICH